MDAFNHVGEIEDQRAIQFTVVVIAGLVLLGWIHKMVRSWKNDKIKE